MSTRDLPVALATMPQLEQLKNPDDDWTGLKSAAERRKRQNRLNVRAHRQRKLRQRFKQSKSYDEEIRPPPLQPRRRQPLIGWSRKEEDFWDKIDVGKFMAPLPVDHRLLILVSYNVLRGIHTNLNILSLHHLITMDCRRGIASMPLFPAPSELPPSLTRTPLQNSKPHGEWIDLIPCPTMRDNAIMLEGTFDHDDLCADVIGGMYDSYTDFDVKKNGMLVWADPWDVTGWELTEGFVKKWGFLIRGCHGMFAATNKWRATRHEDPLVIEL